MFVGTSLTKEPNPMPDRSSKQIEIRLTPAQRERIRWQTGLDIPSIRMSLIELELLTKVAIAAGSETLPVTPSAIKQVSEPEHIGDSFVIEVNLTTKQKEQIKRTTSKDISSLRIVPDDFSPSYREIWTDVSAMRIGRTMVIKRVNDPSESGTERVIMLPTSENSGRDVFGTGRHPATQLSLVLLEEYIESGDRVLDLGTGSGILAVAAARLGASEVLALDIEAAAVAMAHDTVAVNELANTVEVRQGGIESAVPPYDVVAANIFPGVTIHLASDLATNVRRAGVFISSGSVAARAQDVADALCARSFRLEQQCSQNVWRGNGIQESVRGDLVMGLIQPDRGRVLVDRKLLGSELLRSWREQIGYVAQDTFLFNDTVRANLLWACPKAGEEEIWQALKLAATAGFVFELPEGPETVLGNRGVRLSGGERQRLALARALLREPSLLILDEATSALDSENERRIQKAIDGLHGSMTILVTTHRLSTVRGRTSSTCWRAGVWWSRETGRSSWARRTGASPRWRRPKVSAGANDACSRDEE